MVGIIIYVIVAIICFLIMVSYYYGANIKDGRYIDYGDIILSFFCSLLWCISIPLIAGIIFGGILYDTYHKYEDKIFLKFFWPKKFSIKVYEFFNKFL